MMPASRTPEIRRLADGLEPEFRALFTLVAAELDRIEDARPARKNELLKLREAPTSGSYRPDYHADEEDTRG